MELVDGCKGVGCFLLGMFVVASVLCMVTFWIGTAFDGNMSNCTFDGLDFTDAAFGVSGGAGIVVGATICTGVLAYKGTCPPWSILVVFFVFACIAALSFLIPMSAVPDMEFSDLSFSGDSCIPSESSLQMVNSGDTTTMSSTTDAGVDFKLVKTVTRGPDNVIIPGETQYTLTAGGETNPVEFNGDGVYTNETLDITLQQSGEIQMGNGSSGTMRRLAEWCPSPDPSQNQVASQCLLGLCGMLLLAIFYAVFKIHKADKQRRRRRVYQKSTMCPYR